MSGNIMKTDIKQVAALIAAGHIKPGALSPFGSIKPSGPPAKPPTDSRLLEFVKVVSDPAVAIMLKTISTGGVDLARLYAGKDGGNFVRHRADKAGAHYFQQAEEKEILADVSKKMGLDMPASPLGITADISEESFCALMGLIDCWRERALLSLMDRKPKSGSPYALETVYAAYRRSMSSIDLRWLTPLARDLYPGNMDITPDAFYRGARSIGSGLVEPSGSELKLSMPGEEFCASMSAPLSALRITVSGMEKGAVIEDTLIGLRGLATFCTVKAPPEEGVKIQLKESSLPGLELDVHGMLNQALRRHRESGRPQPPPRDTALPTGIPPAQARKFCAKCGKALIPGGKFCPACGAAA